MRFAAVRAIAIILTLISATLAVGCASTGVGSQWREPGRPAKPFKDLLVFGVAAKDKIRRAYETSFVAALKERGVRARPGSKLVPKDELGNPDAIRRAVAQSRAEGVIVTHLVGENALKVSLSPDTYRDPSYYGRLYPYYGRVYDTVTAPGYYASYPVLQLETNLYDARGETLLWSSRSESMDPGSERTTIAQVVESVIAALSEAGYLPQ
jgi:hypothetical protein